MDRATAVRSVLPFTGVIFAGEFCERSEGAAEPCLLPCDRTPCSTPSLSSTSFSTDSGYGSPPSSLYSCTINPPPFASGLTMSRAA
eukprot:857219-Pleurochrysis_carterae.AAC.1